MASTTILFLDVRPKTFIGINLSSFNTSTNFQGIANVPDGLHFIYTGTDANLSLRHGQWLKIRKSTEEPSIVVLKWDNEHEQLNEIDHDNEQTKTLVKRLPEIQRRGLIDYKALREASSDARAEATENLDEDEKSSDQWPGLSSHVTPRLLTRVLSKSSEKRTTIPWTLTSVSSAPADTEHIPGLTSAETQTALADMQNLDLLPIDLKQTWPDDAVGRTRTDMARDRSWYLSHLVTDLTTPSAGGGYGDETLSQARAAKELLGELQFSFLMVLCLANYSCLEQWKRILSVLFTCRSALIEAEEYFVGVIRVLRTQLQRTDDVEGGLFELADESASAWLRKLIKTFKHNIEEVFADLREKQTGQESKAGEKLESALEGLEKWLNVRYGWEDERNVLRRGMVQLEDGEMVELQADELDEDEETGEYAPVVVES